ncbi:MAG TPA: barstar family protein [Nitrospiraceae bacterium]|nr:barstar family protein [Nitrospiraceae bacterium]
MKSPLSLSKHLQSTRAPWTSLLVLKPRDSVESLVKPPLGFVLKSIKGAKCKTPAALFTEFAKVMELPDYFGHNWDALEECLADLDWMPAKGYVLLLTDAEQILPEDEEDYATLLEVLSDAGEAWASGQAGMGERPVTPFHVLFAVTERGKASRAHWGMQEIAVSEDREPNGQRRTSKKRT